MSIVVGVLLLLLALILVSPWVIYPTLVRRFAPVRLKQATHPGHFPTVSVLIPAHNEAQHIRKKLKNTFDLSYEPDLMEVIVCSDGSVDGTDEIVEAYENVKLLRNEQRMGKVYSINRMVEEARGALLLLTDASADLWPGTLRKLVLAINHPEVGLAAARYAVRTEAAATDGAAAETEAGYWGLEARVRQEESDRAMLVAASGAAYLVRHDRMPQLPIDTVNDDFVVPLLVRSTGARVLLVPDAVATDAPTREPSTLYRRWVRIAYGNYQMLWRHKDLFGAGRTTLPLIRKLVRTLSPVWLLLFLAVATFGAFFSPVYAVLAGICWLGAIVGAALVFTSREELPKLLRFARFAALSQLAYLRGLLRFVIQDDNRLWRREAENEPPDLSAPAPIPLRVRCAKRLLDLVVATVALLCFLPFAPFVALAIALDDWGSPFYLQDRMRPGPKGPIPFRMFKFRSMRNDPGAETTLDGDPRITRVGDFIRRHRIDEFPQFINVLLGDMSVVGPRPEQPRLAGELQERIPGFMDRAVCLRPGITGLAQVSSRYAGHSVEEHDQKLRFDMVYLASMYSLRSWAKMEFGILLRTFGVMWSGKGAK